MTSLRLPVQTDEDVLTARTRARALAKQIGFGNGDMTDVAAVVSQLSRSILHYALGGELVVEAVYEGGRRGIVVTARSRGSGAVSPADARSWFLPGSRLHVSLSRAGSLMDEFTITPLDDGGEAVAKKWLV